MGYQHYDGHITRLTRCIESKPILVNATQPTGKSIVYNVGLGYQRYDGHITRLTRSMKSKPILVNATQPTGKSIVYNVGLGWVINATTVI